MIIDFFEKKDRVELSYVSDSGSIMVDEIFMEPDSVNGFFEIIPTMDNDTDCIPNLLSYNGNPVKKVHAHYFKDFNKQEFLSNTLKTINPQLFEMAHKIAIPKLYSFDIETDITEEYGYSTPEKAENKILSISVTDEYLNTILFILKNDAVDLSKFDDNIEQKGYVDCILRDALSHYYNEGGKSANEPLQYTIKVFNDEYTMLSTFISYINKFFHVLFGWNDYVYDWVYIMNRCKILGIDVTKASPTHSLAKEKISQNKALNIPCQYPRHRLLLDYMNIFKASLVYYNLDSYSLDSVASLVLGVGKVSYEGNLSTLYKNDYLKFVAYAFVDSIITMLIHLHSKLVVTFFFQSVYNQIPYMMLNQNPISISLIYQELRRQNKFMTSEEFIKGEYHKYDGAFVKNVVKHKSDAMIGVDFKSLYPNSMISYYLSFDTKINDKILMENGKPANEQNKIKFEEYKKNGYCISPLGRIYKANSNNVISNIEKRLLKERKTFKKIKSEVYLDIIPKIEQKIQELSKH